MFGQICQLSVKQAECDRTLQACHPHEAKNLMNLSPVASAFRSLLNSFKIKTHIVLGGQRAHHAKAKDFTHERSETAGDPHDWFVQQASSHFPLVNSSWNARCIQGRHSMPLGNVQAQAMASMPLTKNLRQRHCRAR